MAFSPTPQSYPSCCRRVAITPAGSVCKGNRPSAQLQIRLYRLCIYTSQYVSSFTGIQFIWWCRNCSLYIILQFYNTFYHVSNTYTSFMIYHFQFCIYYFLCIYTYTHTFKQRKLILHTAQFFVKISKLCNFFACLFALYTLFLCYQHCFQNCDGFTFYLTRPQNMART